MFREDRDWQYATDVKDWVSKSLSSLDWCFTSSDTRYSTGEKDGADKKRRDRKVPFWRSMTNQDGRVIELSTASGCFPK